MPNVFIPQSLDNIKINVLPARAFGDLKTCWDGTQLIHNVFQCSRQIKRSMATAQPGDYLLCIGDPAVIALCAVILHNKTGGNYKILKWDKQERQYYSVVIEMDENEDD